MDDSIYYSGNNILTYNRLLNFILGNRGCGKTFWFKLYSINDFEKKGNQFVWVRRYKPEIKLMCDFFNDMHDKFPKLKMEVKGNKAYINGKVAGYFIPLSVASSYKSVPFPKVTKIIFDEFIIATKRTYYLENEVSKFLDLFSTVARLRNNVRAFFIANSATVANPYFDYFKVQPKLGKQITAYKHIAIENVANEDFIEAAYETDFGDLIKGTPYGNYAVENKFLLDNYVHVEKKPTRAMYQLTLAHNGKYYGIYYDYDNTMVYVTNRQSLNGGFAIAITKDDIEDGVYLSKSEFIRDTIRTIKEMFNSGRCRYDNIRVKSGFYEIMRILNIK